MYDARELAAMEINAIWQLPEGPMKIQFDDGVLESNNRATIYSAYMWGLYVRFPKTPALLSHHLGDRHVGADTHLELLNRVMWDCYDAYEGALDVEELSRLQYQATNRIFNDFTYRLESYARSISILDFIDVIHHPTIKAANDGVKPTRSSIDQVQKTIRGVLRDPRELIGNALSSAAKNGLVRVDQILQCVGPRGYVTDVDSNFFPEPILSGYVQGIRSLHDSMIESRSAAKSLTFAEEPLQKTEYFNRRLQLLAATLTTIHRGVINNGVSTKSGDCGSTTYLRWRVAAGDLPALSGKYYNTSGGLKRLKESDRHLIGEWIEMRSVFHCLHPDSTGVCATCFGELSLSVPYDTNIGHVSATALCEQASQSVLSVKHYDSGSEVDDIVLSEHDQQYIQIGMDGNTIKLADRLDGRRVILTIEAKEATHISDISYVEDVSSLQVTFVSNITQVLLTVVGNAKEESVILPIAVGGRHGAMTHELLGYLKRQGWNLTPSGDYIIDLHKWDYEAPLFVLPLKHMDMLSHIKVIDAFLTATRAGGPTKTLKDFKTPETALQELYALVSSHLFVNIAHLEILVKATMIRSWRALDYRIPHEGNAVEFGAYGQTLRMRSLSAAMAYEKQKKTLNDPSTYLAQYRSDHILDALLLR